MDRRERIDRLDLDKDDAVDDQIESIARVEFLTLVDDRQGELSLDAQASTGNLMCETMLVRGLQQTRAEQLMDL